MKYLAASLCLLCACATTPTGPKPPPVSAAGFTAADYYPMAVGTVWAYEAAMLGERQGINVEMLRTEGEYAIDSTGAQLMADGYGVRDQKRYLLRNPIEVGTKWTNVVSVSSIESYEIVSVDDVCETPAGKFTNCVVVHSSNRVKDGEMLLNDMSFAPKVGIVRIATSLDSHGKVIPQSQLTLTRFVPAPQTPTQTVNTPK